MKCFRCVARNTVQNKRDIAPVQTFRDVPYFVIASVLVLLSLFRWPSSKVFIILGTHFHIVPYSTLKVRRVKKASSYVPDNDVSTLHSTARENNVALVAPLLTDLEFTVNGGETTSGTFGMESSTDPRLLMAIPPPVRVGLIRILQTRCAADALPSALHALVNNGKIVSLAFTVLYLLFISIWFPFWLLALIVSEWGVYAVMTAAVFLTGRSIIRMIAFPGSNSGIAKEMETEFSKYSVRMLMAASNAIIEVLTILVPLNGSSSDLRGDTTASQWNHALSYKDRVLGVYLESLLYLFRQPPSSTHHKDPALTRFGNNRLTGDVGDLSGLTVRRLIWL